MKASAEKSSSTVSRTATQSAQRPFFAKAGGGGFFDPVAGGAVPALQAKMRVNQPGDKFEQEADRMADKVMRMQAPASPLREDRLQRQADDRLQKKEKEEDKIQKAAMPEEKLQKSAMPEERIQKADDKEIQKAEDEKIQKAEDERIQKAPTAEEKLQRKGNGVPTPGPSTQSAIQNQTTGGQPLSGETRGFMEARFGAYFGNIRIHSDPEAASLSNQLSARAFTYRNHVFFSRDQYQPGTSEGKQLLAHELTHTIQQGHAVQRRQQVTTTVTPPPVQRLGVQDALDYFADKAYNIPGFRMLTIVLGFNPINMRSTDRSAANILRALIELVPGGHFITQALDNHGVFNKAGAWVEQKLTALGDIGSDIVAGLKRFLDSLSWTDIFHLGDVWDRAKRIFTDPISRLISFAGSVVSEILKMVKDAILKPLAALAQNTRGYDLLKAILGEDPITGEPVPRTADTLIGGFMKLIGQEEIWNNIKKGNAVARAWAWFQGALSGLMRFVRAIPRRVIDTITSLTFQDIVTVAGAFTKVVGAFVNIAGEFLSWGLNQVISLLEILFSVVAPGVMPYIRKAQAAFVTILKNPIGFVGNLVHAGKMGFQLFAANIVTHLKTALIKWLVGPLGEAGVYIPKSFSLIEIVKLVLSVLGLTWQNIRSKLVKIIPEPVLVGLEKTAGVLVTLVKDGPAAAWEQIKAELSELKDQLIAQVTQMISIEVVKAAVIKLVSMLNPAGAVVQAIIAIYNTITFFIQKINQIAAVVASFIDSIAAIAAGQVTGAAKKVEQTMANTLTVIIAFLAKFAGLGNIPEKLVGIIRKIRQPIDKGLDKIVAWLGKMLKKAAGAVLQAGVPQDPSTRLRLGMQAATTGIRTLSGTLTQSLIAPVLIVIKARYGFIQLEAYLRSGTWWVRGRVNPPDEVDTGRPEKEKTAEEAHNEVMAKMSSDNKLLLKGHGSYTAGHAGRGFVVATRDAVDDIGYATGDHSFPSIKDPGTKGDPATKWGKIGKGNWVPDHQPPDTLAGGGATLTFRFYPHSNSSRVKQGGAVRVYKMWMKDARKRDDANWAEGVKSEWFW
ncbi:MAG: DUF4157 domain-containing protein [Nitrospira sp.]|nr:DUF4157 domain-containing protein [Nitrospira sp.]